MGTTEDRPENPGRSASEPASTAAPAGRDRAQEQADKAERLQRLLDEALADSFPASDPVSIVTSQAEEDDSSTASSGRNQPGSQSRHNAR